MNSERKEWWTCHHCDGVGCEVCEDEGGWFESLDEREEPRTSLGGGSGVKYRTIVADPPWMYEQFIPSHTPSQSKSWRIAKPYKGMTVQAIMALRVRDVCAADCRLFLWATSRYLPDGFATASAWGFTYRQTLVWHKTGNPTPLPAVVAPNHAEFLLVCDIGEPRRLGTFTSSVIASPRRGHSQKPEIVLDEIERITEPPRLEMFARRQRLGWDTWGDEALNHVELPSAIESDHLEAIRIRVAHGEESALDLLHLADIGELPAEIQDAV